MRHVHVHFAGMAARTAYWINEFLGIRYSLTAHANDIFALARFCRVTGEVDRKRDGRGHGERFCRSPFAGALSLSAPKIHRVYNGIDCRAFIRQISLPIRRSLSRSGV
jgi:hypothetical protein